jgi:hypothetical protein
MQAYSPLALGNLCQTFLLFGTKNRGSFTLSSGLLPKCCNISLLVMHQQETPQLDNFSKVILSRFLVLRVGHFIAFASNFHKINYSGIDKRQPLK